VFLGRCLCQFEDPMVETDSYVEVLENSCSSTPNGWLQPCCDNGGEDGDAARGDLSAPAAVPI
jgi:hypothetical protein